MKALGISQVGLCTTYKVLMCHMQWTTIAPLCHHSFPCKLLLVQKESDDKCILVVSNSRPIWAPVYSMKSRTPEKTTNNTRRWGTIPYLPPTNQTMHKFNTHWTTNAFPEHLQTRGADGPFDGALQPETCRWLENESVPREPVRRRRRVGADEPSGRDTTSLWFRCGNTI